ncbi:MAG: ribonuclease D [Pseudomonadota bacterium]|nr:ribonuclease D [Pseudomonadota bacterium]
MAPVIHLHEGDLPDGLDLGDLVAIDTETMGLNPARDRLCLVQLSAGDGIVHLVRFAKGSYNAPNLKRLLVDPLVTKLFHYARFDLGMLYTWLNVTATPVYCTKIASRLTRTYGARHGLKDLCSELLGINIDKQQQTSDWGADTLTEDQKRYAAIDVLYLHQIKDKLDVMLEREKRTHLAQACFDFLPARVLVDLAGWSEEDIFSHKPPSPPGP